MICTILVLLMTLNSDGAKQQELQFHSCPTPAPTICLLQGNTSPAMPAGGELIVACAAGSKFVYEGRASIPVKT